MKISITTMFIVLLLHFLISCTNPVEKGTDTLNDPAFADTASTKILFIGSSYFSFNDLPALFRGLAESSGKKVAIGQDIINGTFLVDHANSSTTAAMIRKAKWDFVFLQDAGPPVGYPETHHLLTPPYTQIRTHWALTYFKQILEENYSKTKTVFMMPWAFEDGLLWVRGQTDTYLDMQKKISDNTIAWSKEIGFTVAPVGLAWQSVMYERSQPHYLFLSDYCHPSLRGSYLTACVFYSTIFKESTLGNTYYGGLSREEAEYFQRIASKTVLDTLDTWNIR